MSDPEPIDQPELSGARLAFNAGSQITADITGKIAVAGLYVAVARVLGSAALGRLTLGLSFAIFLQIAGLGTDIVLMADVAKDRVRFRLSYWRSLRLKVYGAVVIAPLMLLVAALGQHGHAFMLTVGFCMASQFIDQLVLTPAAALRGSGQMAAVASALFTERVVAAAGAVVALVLFRSIPMIAAAYVVGSLVAAVITVRAARRAGLVPERISHERGGTTSLALEALPFGVGTAFGAILARADVIILSILTSASAVGLYSAAYRFYEGTFFVSWAIGAAMFPVIADAGASAARRGQALLMASRVMLAGMLPFGLCLALFPHVITTVVFGHGFSHAGGSTRWLGVAVAMYGVGTVATFALAALKASRTIMIVSIVTTVLNIALNFALIPSLGPTGAGLAQAIAQALTTGLSLLYAARATSRIAWRDVVALPLAGGLAMLAIALVEDRFGGLLLAFVAYWCVVVALHRLLYRSESRGLEDWLRARVTRVRTPTV